jgi:histidyl-tRNA synthetase
VLSLEKQKVNTQLKDGGRISIVFVNEEMKKIAIGIASKLRLKGIPTDLDLLGKSLRKQMENASNSRYVIIVAPKEYDDNLVIIRNMIDGSEGKVKIEILLNNPESNLPF